MLIALADCTSDETGSTFAGQKHIAKQISQGERTVRRHLDWLEKRKYISRAPRRRRNGSRSSDVITLNMNGAEHEADKRP